MSSGAVRRVRDRVGEPAGPVVLWLASEAVPWVSTGGLGDVVGSLPRVLRGAGWDVRLCLPLYAGATASPLLPALRRFEVRAGARTFPVAIREAADPPGGVPTYLVECNPLFNRRGIYGDDAADAYPDNPVRFGVWQLAARELAASLAPAPAILHCHDWHAALLPALLGLPGQRPAALRDARTILTIHNLQFQGHTDRAVVDSLGLPRAIWHPRWLEHFGGASFMKAGILSADRVTTVSRSYADEIRTPELGMGLDGPLRERGEDLAGLVNGIDIESWNPSTDPALPQRYDVGDRSGRARCKNALQSELGLRDDASGPVLGFIGRLSEAKGVDLLIQAVPRLVALGAQVVVLGSGDRALASALVALERDHPGKVRAHIGFDVRLARRIYGGVDAIVVPSRVEPCGLVQLYALRYGAVPIVAAVGGLRDTVRDGETGFVFRDATAASLLHAVERALAAFSDRRRWDALQRAGMQEDWSWTQSAAGYDALYRATLAAPLRVRPAPAPVDDVGALYVDSGPDLPSRRGVEELRLMVQGPESLYAYWETAAGGALALVLEERPSGQSFVLGEDAGQVGEVWAKSVPEAAYRATLRRSVDGVVIAVSNVVITPRNSPAAAGEAAPRWLDELLAAGPREASRARAWDVLFGPPAGPEAWRGDRGRGRAAGGRAGARVTAPGNGSGAGVAAPDVPPRAQGQAEVTDG